MSAVRKTAPFFVAAVVLFIVGAVVHLAFLAGIGILLALYVVGALLVNYWQSRRPPVGAAPAPSDWQQGNGTAGWLRRRGERRFEG